MTGIYHNEHQTITELLQSQGRCVHRSLEILDPDNYPDYTADGLIDIRVGFDYGDYITAKFNEAKYKRANSLSMPTIGDKGLEALAHIEWETTQGPEHLRHNFKVVNGNVPGDPEEPVDSGGGRERG